MKVAQALAAHRSAEASRARLFEAVPHTACLKRWSRPQHDVAITAVEQRRPSDRMQQMTGFPLIDIHQHDP
jgi:hypothetical protein